MPIDPSQLFGTPATPGRTELSPSPPVSGGADPSQFFEATPQPSQPAGRSPNEFFGGGSGPQPTKSTSGAPSGPSAGEGNVTPTSWLGRKGPMSYTPVASTAGGSTGLTRDVELWHRLARKNLANFSASLQDLDSPTVAGKLVGALESVLSAGSLVATPVEWLIGGTTEAVSRSALPEATARKVGEKAGEYGGFAAQVAFDPAGGAFKAAKKLSGAPTNAMHPMALADQAVSKARNNPLSTSVESLISPTSRSPEAAKMGEIIQSHMGQAANRYWAVEQQLNEWKPLRNIGPEGFKSLYTAISRGDDAALDAMPPQFKAFAENFRYAYDELTKEIQAEGWLDQAREHYVGGIWKNPKGALGVIEKAERAASKKPWAGSKNFLKAKTFDFMDEAFAAGMEPVTWDPVEYAMLKYREMSKFLYATRAKKEAIASLPVRFYKGGHLPEGVVALDDPSWKAVLPPAEVIHEALHETAFDAGIKSGLERFAQALGVNLKTPLRSQDPHLAQGSLGYATTDGKNVASRFGNNLEVLEHEIGHQIDNRTGLWQYMAGDQQAWRELGQLALRRANLSSPAPAQAQAISRILDAKYPYSDPGKNYLMYLLSGKERVAHMFHAYWFAPDVFRAEAPTAFKLFEKWMSTEGQKAVNATGVRMRDLIRNVKPSLSLGEDQMAEVFKTQVPGWRHLGQWGAPEEVATVFNNYIAPGLRGSKTPGVSTLWEGFRQGGNAINMLQLGISAFHFTFTNMDVVTSETARAVEQAMHKEFGKAIKTGVGGQVPFLTGVRKWRSGQKLRKGIQEYYSSKSVNMDPEMRNLVKYYLESGGRPQMDVFYRAVDKGIVQAFRDGTFTKAVFGAPESRGFLTYTGVKPGYKIAMMALQSTMHPIMEVWVPRIKLGVWADLAKDYLRRNPNASPLQARAEMQKAWESIDNRLGQMVYDNQFWNKTLKDLAFIAIRAVGWRVGTLRELGGAAVDAQKAVRAWGRGEQIDFTHRMAYAIALPIQAAIYGSIVHYLYTGKAPENMKDRIFPRTGGTTAKGGQARVVIPSYMKDVLVFNETPIQYMASGMHPLWEIVSELHSNRDFYGGIIWDPREDIYGKARDFSDYAMEQMLPFSMRSYRKLQKDRASMEAQIGSFMGIQAAPGYITDPNVSEAWQRKQDVQAIRRKMKHKLQ